jgi:hypothetical protein
METKLRTGKRMLTYTHRTTRNKTMNEMAVAGFALLIVLLLTFLCPEKRWLINLSRTKTTVARLPKRPHGEASRWWPFFLGK